MRSAPICWALWPMPSARRSRGTSWTARTAGTSWSGCGRRRMLLPRSVEQVEPPASLKRSLMEVVEREALRARRRGSRPARRPWGERLRELFGGSLRPRMVAGRAGRRAAGRVRRGAAGRRRERRPHGGRPRAPCRARAGASRSRATAPTAAAPGPRDALARGGQVYQAWVQRDGMIEPEPTFEVDADGRGAVAVPEDLAGAQAVMVTREPRGGVPRAQRAAGHDGHSLAAASFP